MDQPLPATRNGFTVLPLGDAAVTVEFGREIAPTLTSTPSLSQRRCVSSDWEGVIDIVPAYASV